MKIGILLPTILTTVRFKNRIYAARDLAIDLADGLVGQGHTVKIYASESLETKAEIVGGIDELELEPKQSVKDVWKSESVRQELSQLRNSFEYNFDLLSKALMDAKSGEIEIIHSYDDYISHYFVDLCSVPFVYTLHDQVFRSDTFEFWRLKRFANHNYIAISEAQRKLYESEMSLNIVKTIYHGISPDRVSFSEKGGQDMLFIGRLLPQKGVEDAIESATGLKHKLSIASSSNYKETDYYKLKILPHLNSEYVEQVGYLSGETKNTKIQQSKVTLLPIKGAESFGMIMIESMLAGTPVVAYSRGSVSEVLVDGKTGFVVDPSEGVEGFKRAVNKIYDMSEKDYMEMRAACREHVINNFSLKRMVDNHIELYQRIITKSTQHA